MHQFGIYDFKRWASENCRGHFGRLVSDIAGAIWATSGRGYWTGIQWLPDNRFILSYDVVDIILLLYGINEIFSSSAAIIICEFQMR